MARSPEVEHLLQAIEGVRAAIKHDTLSLKEQEIEEEAEPPSRQIGA